MPATPTHQDPLQDRWRVEELTPDTRRRLFEPAPRPIEAGRAPREGPGRRAQPHTERPLSH